MNGSAVQHPIGFRPEEISAMINETVVEQHAEEAAFLWTQRDRGVHAPNFRLKDLARWDERVEAHLDGLRVAGQFGWQLCEKALAEGGPGEVFAAGVLAFGCGDPDRIKAVLEAGASVPKLQRALISALGWLPFSDVEGAIRQLLDSELPGVRCVGIAGCAVHRSDPGQTLHGAILDLELHLRARALKACGELGKTSALEFVLRSLSDGDASCRFFAAWSAARLGNRSQKVLGALREIAMMPGRYAERALDMAVRVMDLNDAKAWQRQLNTEPTRLKLAALAAGAIGDPALVGDLIQLMKLPPVARAAGAAFSMITGVDLPYDDLDGDAPADFQAGPTENPEDENVALDPDESLPWPVADKVAAWWKRNGSRFAAGRRHLCGREIGEVSLREVLAKGYQPQRAAAALELGLRQPNLPLVEVRARGGIQSAKA